MKTFSVKNYIKNMIKYNPKWIYLMRCIEKDGNVSYKIGYTKNDPIKRTEQLQTGNKYEVELIHKFWSDYSTKLESILHKSFKQYKDNTDKLHHKDNKGGKEWFDLPQNIVDDFISICEVYEKNFKFLVEKNTYLQDKYISKK